MSNKHRLSSLLISTVSDPSGNVFFNRSGTPSRTRDLSRTDPNVGPVEQNRLTEIRLTSDARNQRGRNFIPNIIINGTLQQSSLFIR